MLPDKRRVGAGGRCFFARNGGVPAAALVGGKIDPAEPEFIIEAGGVFHDLRIGLVRRAHDKLGRLFDTVKFRPFRRAFGDEFERPDDVVLEILFCGQMRKRLRTRGLDVDRHRGRKRQRLLDGGIRGTGDDFNMDVAAISVFGAQYARSIVEKPHGVVRRAHHAGGEKNPENMLPPDVRHEYGRHFVRAYGTARDVRRGAKRAVFAVVDANVGHECFEHD